MSSVLGLRSHISEATDGASWICDTGYTLDPQLSNLPITKHLFFFLKILFIHLRERACARVGGGEREKDKQTPL